MQEKIVASQRREFRNFKFYDYSLLMHLILYKNIGYLSTYFIDQTLDLDGDLLVQIWTQVLDRHYPYSSFVSFLNNLSSVVMKMLGAQHNRIIEIICRMLWPIYLKNGTKLDHNWGDAFLFHNISFMRVNVFPQPSHILPRYIPTRLGTFLCRSFKIGDFTIGKEAID